MTLGRDPALYTRYPPALARLYEELNKVTRVLIKTAERNDFSVKDKDREYILKAFSVGIGLFEKGGNSATPSGYLSVGAYVTAARNIRGQIQIFRSNKALSNAFWAKVVKKLYGLFPDKGIKIEHIKTFPHLQVKRPSGAFFKQAHDPIVLGASISRYDTAIEGSLGFFAQVGPAPKRDGDEEPAVPAATTSSIVFVSAGHVMIDDEEAAGTNIFHPSRKASKDQDLNPKQIGRGVKGYSPFADDITPIDAAYSVMLPGIDFDSKSVGDGELVSWISDESLEFEGILDSEIIKVGATTGLRQGNLVGLKENLPVELRTEDGRFLGIGAIADVVLVRSSREGEAFSGDGDSGAPVFATLKDNKFTLLSIIVAGISKGLDNGSKATSYVCPIWKIAETLNVVPYINPVVSSPAHVVSSNERRAQ